MTTFIERTEIGDAGTAVAVKDLIDVAGLPTTGGCRALALSAEPADADAECLAGLRAEIEAGTARIVGKTNLDELAVGITGVNAWYGTPHNPLDPGLVPGGSSSGSAVAVAVGDAEIGIGTDTGGSIRIPAACCGVTGLKTSHGRVSVAGVLPACQSLDTVGPLARDVAGVVRGMELLEPGFTPASAPAEVVGRLRVPGVAPVIDDAVDRALERSGLRVVEIEMPGWAAAFDSALGIILAELWRNDGELVEGHPGEVGAEVARVIALAGGGATSSPAARMGLTRWPDEATARLGQRAWRAELTAAFEHVQLIATPTLLGFPPPLEKAVEMVAIANTQQINLAGGPALALPVESGRPLPASLQLCGPSGSEELLTATGAVFESAAGARLHF